MRQKGLKKGAAASNGNGAAAPTYDVTVDLSEMLGEDLAVVLDFQNIGNGNLTRQGLEEIFALMDRIAVIRNPDGEQVPARKVKLVNLMDVMGQVAEAVGEAGNPKN